MVKAKKAAKAAPAKKKAGTEPKAKPSKAVRKIFNNDDPEAKSLFLQHNKEIEIQRAKLARAGSDLRNLYKSAKAQGGFEKADFDYAVEVKTAEAEAKTRAKIVRRLQIARYMGSDLGAQLDMFNEPDRTPAIDRAYNEGETASMKNEKASPSYAPDTEQYRNYMAGFHDHQAKLAKGIKKPEPAERAAEQAEKAAAQQKAEDAKEFVTSGQPMTRSDFEAAQRKSHFSKA